MARNIFFLCPNWEMPLGGLKKIYQHVDILCSLGLNAYVVHSKVGHRLDWFNNKTPIAYMLDVNDSLIVIDEQGTASLLPAITEEDILVIPELLAYQIAPRIHDKYFVIFNQGAYLTFLTLPLPSIPFSGRVDSFDENPYENKNLLSTLVISQDSYDYLHFIFPNNTIHRIHCAMDYSKFYYQRDKKKQIAFMPRKCHDDVVQVIKILQQRGKLHDWIFVPIDDLSEDEVAAILRDSEIFLSFSFEEGFGMPAAEAMAAGCIVVGYDGFGGKEFLKEPYAHPIGHCDIIAYVKKIEEIVEEYERNPGVFNNERRIGSEYIHHHYSQEREKEDLNTAWKAILQKHDNKDKRKGQ